jgi:molybdenum cofactor cytidylyltransferase
MPMARGCVVNRQLGRYDAGMSIPILILAAGASSRMGGRDKLLEDVHGAPCLQVMAKRALATGQPVILTLPDLDHPRARCLDGLDVQVIAVPDADLGMSRSLRRGVAAVSAASKGVMVLPADMPEITTQDMKDVQAAFLASDALALRATTASGDLGHPTVFGVSLFEEIQNLTGDTGAQSILSKLGKALALHPLTGDRARLDLDTPEAWAAWRADP